MEHKEEKEGKVGENWIFDNFNNKVDFENYINTLSNTELLKLIKKYTKKDKYDKLKTLDPSVLEERIINWWIKNKDELPDDRNDFEYIEGKKKEEKKTHSIYDDLSVEEKNKLLTKEKTKKIFYSLIDELSNVELIILNKLKETGRYNHNSKFLVKKLLGKLTNDELKEITELEDEYTREPLDFNDKDSIIEFIIDNIDFNDYYEDYFMNKIDMDNLKLFMKSIPGEYGKILNNPLIYHKIINDKDNIKSLVGNILENPNVPFNLLKQFLDNKSFIFSSNRSITPKDIKDNPQIKWNYLYLSENKNMTWKFIQEIMETKEYQSLEADEQWNFYDLVSHQNITFDIIQKNPQYPWNDDNGISRNPNITIKIIKENPDIEWDQILLAKNPNITLKDILENKDIFKNQEKCIDNYISSNINTTIKDIIEYGKDNDIEGEGSNISFEDIKNNPSINWNMKELTLNPNLTYDTLFNNTNILFPQNNFKNLILNEYGYDKNAKQRYNVKFPQYWNTVHYLYQYIYDDSKELKEVYRNAQFINEKTYKDMDKAVLLNMIPIDIDKLLDGNEYYKKFMYNSVNTLINIGYKNNVKIKLNDESLEMLSIDLFETGGGFHIRSKIEKLNKKQCGDDNEFFTQENFKDLDINNLVSFELDGKVFCLNREDLINFWNQELDETGSSGAINYGDCKFDENDNPYEDSCKPFYKIPIPATYISEKTKLKIEYSFINYWKLIYDKTVRMGRGLHYIGEYDNPQEKIYKVVEKKVLSKF